MRDGEVATTGARGPGGRQDGEDRLRMLGEELVTVVMVRKQRKATLETLTEI